MLFDQITLPSGYLTFRMDVKLNFQRKFVMGSYLASR